MGLKLNFSKALVKDNTDRVKKAESEILQQAERIALSVMSEDYNGNVIASLINQTSTTIKLKAKNIELEGLVTANNNFKILPDGSIEAVNAKLSGAITATKMVASAGEAYYGEVGITGGVAGLGLYDTTRASSPYFRVIQEVSGNRFTGFRMLDNAGRLRIRVSEIGTTLYSINANTYISIGEYSIDVVVGGRVVKQFI